MAALGLASSNPPSFVSPVYPPLVIFLLGARFCFHLFSFFFLFRQCIPTKLQDLFARYQTSEKPYANATSI